MRTLPGIAPTAPRVDDDQLVPEELVGRLYHCGESAVLNLLGGLSSTERANLAMFCYRKAHLHRIGLAIAATCDLHTLVQGWGTALGQAVFAQSRAMPAEPNRVTVGRRSKITLSRGAEFSSVAPGIVPDDPDDLDESLDLGTLPDPANLSLAPSIISAVEPF